MNTAITDTNRLTAENVQSLIGKLMYLGEDDTAGTPRHDEVLALMENGTPPEDGLVVETVMATVMLNKDRVAEHVDDISVMLDQLPDIFKEGSGEGGSVVLAHQTADGEDWTHELDGRIDMLLALGLSVGKVKFVLPRDLWSVLPDSYPFFVVLSEATGEYDSRPLVGNLTELLDLAAKYAEDDAENDKE